MAAPAPGLAAGVPPGLSSVEAERRLARDGLNELPKPRRPPVLARFARQLTHLLALLLWAAAGMALIAGQPPLVAAIVVVVLLNAVFAFAQEYRADRSAERLTDLLPRSCRVRRDGRTIAIDAARLVVDDIVLLDPGDRISGRDPRRLLAASAGLGDGVGGRRRPCRSGRPAQVSQAATARCGRREDAGRAW